MGGDRTRPGNNVLLDISDWLLQAAPEDELPEHIRTAWQLADAEQMPDPLSDPPGALLAAYLAEPATSGLGDARLLERITGLDRQAAWAAAGQLTAIAELATRRVAELGSRGLPDRTEHRLPRRHLPGGHRPPKVPGWCRVQVKVSADWLLGHSTESPVLTGHGHLPADVALRLIADAGWQRIIYQPQTGALLDVGTTVHDPPPALREHVLARDDGCTQPICSNPRADWPGAALLGGKWRRRTRADTSG